MSFPRILRRIDALETLLNPGSEITSDAAVLGRLSALENLLAPNGVPISLLSLQNRIADLESRVASLELQVGGTDGTGGAAETLSTLSTRIETLESTTLPAWDSAENAYSGPVSVGDDLSDMGNNGILFLVDEETNN